MRREKSFYSDSKCGEHENGDPHWQSLPHWLNATPTPTREELEASSAYLRVLAHLVESIVMVDEMLVLREEVDGAKRVIVPTSLIGEVIEEAHQGPGTADEGVTKLMERQGIHITGLE